MLIFAKEWGEKRYKGSEMIGERGEMSCYKQ